MNTSEVDETTQIYFESVRGYFLELCDKYEIPKPNIMTLSDDGENRTDPPNFLAISVNLQVSSIYQARHLFGHWLGGFHYPPHEDLVANTIANMVDEIENKVVFSSSY